MPFFKQKEDRIKQLYTCKILRKLSFETLNLCIYAGQTACLMPTNYNENSCFLDDLPDYQVNICKHRIARRVLHITYASNGWYEP
jgi:hypothetical protein